MTKFKWLIKTLSAKWRLVIASLILLTQFHFLSPLVTIQPVFATSMADLVVSKWGPEAVNPTRGSRKFMWYITVFNQGSAAAEDVTVVDTLPAGVKYLSDTSGVPRHISGNVITWDLYRLDPGTGVYFWVKVEINSGVPAGTVLTNQVDVSTTNPESDLTNNRAQTDTRVGEEEGADVWVEKIGPDSVFPGSYMVYTINYGNGDWHCEWPLDVDDAEAVTITDIMSNWDEEGNMLPNYFSYVSDTSGFPRSGTGTVDDPIVWTVGTLPANTCGSFQVTVHVHADAPDGLTLSNDAIISSRTEECDARNNDYEVDTPVEVSGSIGDYVWNDVDRDGIQDAEEAGINGVVVELYHDETGDGVLGVNDLLLYTTTTISNPDAGWYNFTGLAADDYIVKVADSNFESGAVLDSYFVAVPNAGSDDTIDSDGYLVTHEAAVTLDSGENNMTIDFGFSDCEIGDRVWYDQDEDGDQTNPGTGFDDDGFNDVAVYLYKDNGDGVFDRDTDEFLYVTTTISGTSQTPDGFPNGIYGFDMTELDVDQDYWVWVDESTLPDPGLNTQWVSTTRNNPFKLTYPGGDDFSIDFGYSVEATPTAVTLSSFAAESSAGGSASGLWLGLAGLTVLAAGSLLWAKRRTGDG